MNNVEKYYRVTLVDLSEKLVEQAERNAKESGVVILFGSCEHLMYVGRKESL